jgi:hypothetical protein
MAWNQFSVPASTVACVASTIKTVVGVTAAANICVQITEASASFDGATSSNAPAIVEFDQITFATNAPGTNSTTSGPVKKDTGRGETFQCSGAKAWSAQPTVITSQWFLDIGQYNGVYHYILPFASPFICIGGKGCGISVTSPNNVNYSGKIDGIE